MLPIGNLSQSGALKRVVRHAFIESTRHNFSPIIHGAALTADRFGQLNHAYAFDGVDDYVEVPDNPSLSLPREYSLVLTFKTSCVPTAGSGIVVGNNVINTMHLLQKEGSYRITMIQNPRYVSPPHIVYDQHGTSVPALFNTKILPNQYYQLDFTYTDRTLRVALNGEIKEEMSSIDEPVVSTAPLIVGNSAHPDEMYYSRKFFKGVIDQMQIFDWALSDAEIAILYESGVL